MTLGQLMELHMNGALNAKIEEGSDVGTLGGVQLTYEQAQQICATIGWTEYVLSPFEVIKKTNNLMAAIKKSPLMDSWSEGFMKNVQIEMQNKRGRTYGRTFDRFVFYTPDTAYTLIHGMENAGGQYVIFEKPSAIPFAKCRTIGKALEALASRR
jgi:hypothetical protein